jgi:hypothetical protein
VRVGIIIERPALPSAPDTRLLTLHLIQQSIREAGSSFTADEITAGAIRIPAGLLVAFVVSRLVRRVPWPRPFRFRFLACTSPPRRWPPPPGSCWRARGRRWSWEPRSPSGWPPSRDGRPGERDADHRHLSLRHRGGVSLAFEGSARAAAPRPRPRAPARGAAGAAPAALPLQRAAHGGAAHPIEPQRAAEAAELVADLLRTTLEEKRDEVTLRDEWSFVSRYLAIERIRFGERLAVRSELPDGLLGERVPAFALQTLVENAVLHGAAPRVAATEIVVSAAGSARELTLSVRNSGDGPARASGNGTGTGLARLRERLAVLYGSAARLACGPAADGGYEAVLVVPRATGGRDEGEDLRGGRRAGGARRPARDAPRVRLGGRRR